MTTEDKLSLVLYVCFVDRCLSFYRLSFGPVPIRLTAFHHPFGIFKPFCNQSYL